MLSKLRGWLRGLFGSDEQTGSEAEARETGEATGQSGGVQAADGTASGSDGSALTCPICGTSNPADATACSLCGSSDLRPAAGTDQSDGGDQAAGADSATAASPDDADAGEGDDGGLAGSGTRTERVADAPDADRLSEVRAEGELLVRHRDRWERLPHEERFRVDLPDGERVVDSRDEVRELLRTFDEGA